MADVTIIIPTYNRTKYLRRILNYYDSFPQKGQFKIFVADSSLDENKALNNKETKSHKDLDITYLGEYPPVANGYLKFADVVNRVKTEFCVFCADDDFITPEGILKAVQFLSKNPTYAACQGRIYTLSLAKDISQRQALVWQPASNFESLDAHGAKDRLLSHLSTYAQPTIYAVHRTSVFRTVFEVALSSNVDLLIFGELLFSMLTVILGKLKCLDTFYACRDAISVPTSRHLPTLKTAKENGSYDAEYDKFRKALSSQICKVSEIGYDESNHIIDRAMSNYLRKYYSSGSPFAPLTTQTGLFLDKAGLPYRVRTGISKAYQVLTGHGSRSGQAKADASLYNEDIEKISAAVLKSLEWQASSASL